MITVWVVISPNSVRLANLPGVGGAGRAAMLSQQSLQAFTRDHFFSDEHLARECGANAAVKGLPQPRFWVRIARRVRVGLFLQAPAVARLSFAAWPVSAFHVCYYNVVYVLCRESWASSS